MAGVVAAAASRPVSASITPVVRVGLYLAVGVHPVAFAAAKDLLDRDPGFRCTLLKPAQVTASNLAEHDVIVFMGGSGSAQGRALGDAGKTAVREFVAGGGGYIGVCAGAYLALQGEDEFHKLRLVAGRNLTGDAWQRGIAGIDVETVEPTQATATTRFKLFYANGPIFTPAPTPGLAAYVSLANYRGDLYKLAKGTAPDQMPGTPAIVAAAHGHGRVLLFSPNPLLGSEGIVQPSLMLAGLRWTAKPGPVPQDLGFSAVFDAA